MKPEEFIALAGKVVGFGAPGARSAVSRAYYGAFLEATRLLNGHKCGLGDGRASHGLIPLFLKAASHSDATDAADLIDDLRAERLAADYEMGNADVEKMSTARTAVETALEAVRLLTAFDGHCRTTPHVLQSLQSGVAKHKAVRGLK